MVIWAGDKANSVLSVEVKENTFHVICFNPGALCFPIRMTYKNLRRKWKSYNLKRRSLFPSFFLARKCPFSFSLPVTFPAPPTFIKEPC